MKIRKICVLMITLLLFTGCTSVVANEAGESKEVYEMGEKIYYKNLVFTVDKIEDYQGDDNDSPDKKCYIVTVTITNNGTKNYTYDSKDFWATDSTGLKTTDVFTASNNATRMGSGTLAHGESITKTLIYLQDKEVEDISLIYTSNFLFYDSTIFKVEMK